MSHQATVTITVRDDPANPTGVNVVLESEPPYPLLPGDSPDVDSFTNAQVWGYAAVEQIHSLTRDPGEFQIIKYLDLPDAL